MKKYLQRLFVVAVIGIMCFSSMNIRAAAPQNEAAYLEKYQTIVQAMKTEMGNVLRTGDPALDYLYQMIPHHQGAVNMAQNVLQYATNQKVKQMAQKMIKEQTDEIAEMKRLGEKIKTNSQIYKAEEAAYGVEFMQFYEAMIDAMEAVKPTGDVDKDFLQGMMPHHEGSINISRSILRYTSNSEVRKLAENIVKKQTDESKEMSKLVSQMK